ncbi:MAG TPA: alpha/beta hydrolase, partial [Chloroflexia bacterium]|nr:alpha/beta hydrolase [Chloroflexia bacterium]
MDRQVEDGRRLELDFAISLASRPSQGVLIYAVGGPGYSGVAVADDYLATLDPKLVEHVDIVFFDQRGVGASYGLQCPEANGVFDLTVLTPDEPALATAAAEGFVRDCLAELEHAEVLPHVGTDEAARDLEAFRKLIGSPRVWIYGESYGTQLAQRYATLFPESLKGVILDSPVDLTLELGAYYAAFTRGAEDLLQKVLRACSASPDCASSMSGDPQVVLDDLWARAEAGPIQVEVTLEDGSTVVRELNAAMLDAAAFFGLYTAEQRTHLLKALAAASHGDLAPLVELAYVDLGIDLGTGRGVSDPSWYGAAYYAINCLDYAVDGCPSAAAEGIMRDAAEFAPRAPHFLRSYFAERLACAFWPERGAEPPPQPYLGGAFPTLILVGDSDPITPISMATAILREARNAYLVAVRGGGHITLGRGYGCSDAAVTAMVVDGALPSSEVTECATPLL